MLKKLHLYLLLLCSLIGFGSYAQTYPISITTQLAQPSPIYLSNYADAATINSPIKIQLVLNDLTISNRQVKLKIYFQGNGISFSTNDFVVGAQPLYLEGGFPLLLTNVDLAPYFEYQNLLGLNPNQYAQPLPEGIYNIYVEVYDFATGKKLSNKTGSTTIIFQNDPPFLNLPLNNASIMQQNIQNIIFSWTPRSINVSNVEYEFSLVEIWDKYTPVQNAFAYSPPLYTTTTRTTTLQYGINEPQLIPGKKYAWRIKARAILGAEEIGVFKNNGYSEIFSFNYEMFCTSPLAIKTSGVSENQAKIEWSGNIDNYDYQVNYREKNANSEWYKLVTPRETITLSNLKPNTTYEYTVGASCQVGKYTHSTIKEFTTIARDEIAFAGCGIEPDPKDLANKTPLPELFPNDVVTAGDFPIVVLHSTGSNGKFSGDGYVTLPFLEKFRKLIDAADALGGDKINIGQFSRIRITFDNIGVNTDFKLISGEIIASYDPDWKGMADGDKLVDSIKDLINSLFVKADKLEEQKKAGLINDEDYKKELETIWNDIKKADEDYKSLIKNTDLPQNLKDKIANIIPPLPSHVSNDDTAIKNDFKAQSQEYRQQITNLKEEADAFFKENCNDINDGNIVLQNQKKYVMYATPVGEAIILNNATNLDFDSIYPNEAYPDLNVPKGALVAFTIDDNSYNAKYKKESGKWKFIGYVTKDNKEYFDTDTDQQKEYFASVIEEKGINNAECSVIVGTLAQEGLWIRLLTSLGLGETAIAATLSGRAILTGTGVAIGGYLLMKFFGSGGVSVTYHYGDVLDLPAETTPILPIADNYLKDIPVDLPITIPHALLKEETEGKCKVYVIWKIAKDGNISVAKYGMTCTDDYEDNCNMRPEKQCRKFEKENNPENYKFHYNWVTKGVSKDITHILEKSLTASYLISHGGIMPSHHYLPCFVRDKHWDEDLEGRSVESERTSRAIKWLKDMFTQYGAK